MLPSNSGAEAVESALKIRYDDVVDGYGITGITFEITIDVIRGRDLLADAERRGGQLRAELAAADLPNAVDVRGRGLMQAVEFDSKERRDAVEAETITRGLLTLACGNETLRLLPPPDVREREVSMAVELPSEAVRAAAGLEFRPAAGRSSDDPAAAQNW